VQDRYARGLTRVEKTNAVDIHEINLPQIQRYSWSATLDLTLQLIKVFRSKLSAQTNPRLALTGNPIDLQCHELWPEVHTWTEAIITPFAIPCSAGT
jgi:hypothetical protein